MNSSDINQGTIGNTTGIGTVLNAGTKTTNIRETS